MVAETVLADKPAIHGKAPTRKDWERAAREATGKERIGPGLYRIQSSRHAHLYYRVDLTAGTCPCPARGDCWHLLEAERLERSITQDEQRRQASMLRAELRRLHAEYGDTVWHLAIEREVGA